MSAQDKDNAKGTLRTSYHGIPKKEKSGPVRFDFLEDLFARNNGRDPALLQQKWRRMAEDPFHFYRGSAGTFYHLWAMRRLHSAAPSIWVCGDAHWENVGSYRAKNRIAYFDLTDFDQACLAPIDRDLGRALTAYYVARASHLAPLFLSSYRETLVGGKPQHIEEEVAKGAVAKLLTSVSLRRRKKFIASWTDKGRIAIKEGVTYALSRRDRQRAARVFNVWARQHERDKFFKITDLCGSLAGIGTLGLQRYLILVKGGRRPHLIDMKEAVPSALADHHRPRQPVWQCEAERVATLQKYTQYVPIAHLGWTQFRRSSFVLSDFQPAEDRINALSLPREEHEDFSRKWGRLLAWSHLRTASWKNSGTIDELIGFGKSLTVARQKSLIRDAAAIGRAYSRAYADFLALGPFGEK